MDEPRTEREIWADLHAVFSIMDAGSRGQWPSPEWGANGGNEIARRGHQALMELQRRAGLSPIARTEIADAQAAFAVVWKWVSCGPKIAPDDVYEASGRVFRALDSVLGAESTKETK